MSVIPSGVSIQEMYRRYRENLLVVNRRYQRKLVWTEQEKECLVDSIMKGYPIPLILFAEKIRNDGIVYYEILDGMQRLNAIFSFIENEFPWQEKYFDVNQLARAKQAETEGLFKGYTGDNLLNNTDCANFLDYQLAVTSYKTSEPKTVFEVFQRINSGGHMLGNQEQRQAGILCDFSDLVKDISAELRGDATSETINLCDMPQISIGSARNNEHYGLKAEDTFWVKQGILAPNDLRNSGDEEFIADIIISILQGKPFARSKESLDKVYDLSSEVYKNIEIDLIRYTKDKVKLDVQNTFSVIKNCIESVSSEKNFLRTTVLDGSGSPIKNAFYSIFMAFFDLLVKENLSPVDNTGILKSLKGLQSRIRVQTHYATTEDRIANINVTKGLLRSHFVKKEPSALSHGSGLALDFENSLRRSKIETPRYEFKQGFLRLSTNREWDISLEEQILKTICAIANIGPSIDGYIYIGVADKKTDADRIKSLDSIEPIDVSSHFVVGIDREATQLGVTIDTYCRKIIEFIRSSKLSENLISSVLSNIDIIDYKTLSVIRIKVPAQIEMSYYNDDVYVREYSETIKKSSAKEILAISERFKSAKK